MKNGRNGKIESTAPKVDSSGRSVDLEEYSLVRTKKSLGFRNPVYRESFPAGWSDDQIRGFLCGFLPVNLSVWQNGFNLYDVVVYSLLWNEKETDEFGDYEITKPCKDIAWKINKNGQQLGYRIGVLKSSGLIQYKRQGKVATISFPYSFFKQKETTELVYVCNGLFFLRRLRLGLIYVYSYLYRCYKKLSEKYQANCYLQFPCEGSKKVFCWGRDYFWGVLEMLNTLGLITLYKKPDSPILIQINFDPVEYFSEVEIKKSKKKQ